MMIQVYTAIITPFQAGGEIDYSIMEELIKWQTRSAVDGLVVCGTNGEFSSLSYEEVKSLLQFTFKSKKGNLKIIAGTGRANVKETVDLCNFCEGLADQALIVPPFYFKDLNPLGVYTYFRQVLEKTRIPLILYHIPKYTGVSITPDLINKLKSFKNLVGVKDSSGTLQSTEEFLAKCQKLQVYAGSDALIYSSFDKGASGVISSISNIFPKEVLQIKNSFLAGNKPAAQAAQETVSKIRAIIKQFPSHGAVKYVLSLLGYPLSFVRPPLVDLSEEQQLDLKKKLQPFISV
jgi:4-hydroxy-tetrahydrodipicolinate synthase